MKQNKEKKTHLWPLILGGIVGLGGTTGGIVLLLQHPHHNEPQPTEDLVTLRFNGNGGTIKDGMNTVKAQADQLFGDIIKPAAVNPGYTFNGWYADQSGNKPISQTALASSVPSEIYAGWVPETNIKVIFSKGQTASEIVGQSEVAVTQKGTRFNEINKPSANSKTPGQILDHWSKDEFNNDPMADDEIIPDNGITLYPVFKEAPTRYVLLKFSANGGNLEGTSEFNVPLNTAFGTIAKPIASKKGLDFKGWSKDEAGNEPIKDTELITQTLTLYAQYQTVDIEEKIYYTDSSTNKNYWLTNPSSTSGDLIFQDEEGVDETPTKWPRKDFNETITIGSKVKSIGINFLYECYAFNNGGKALEIPSNVESIGDSFLHLCSGFNQPVDLSKCTKLTSIGSSFMQFCITFNSKLTLPGAQPDVEELTIGAFFLQSCLEFNKEIVLPNNITTIPGSFMGSCEAFNNGDENYDPSKQGSKPFVIPKSVTSIQSYFLASCFAGIVEGKVVGFNQPIMIPNSVEFIAEDFLYGNGAFNSSITFENECKIKTIEDAFLTGCTRFNQSFKIPPSITTIKDYFFYQCARFNQEITIPSNVTSLGNSFMSNCSRFNQNITFGSTIKHIGRYFMYYCADMVSTLTINCFPWDPDEYNDDYTLGSGSPNAACIEIGITIGGTYRAAFMNLFENHNPSTGVYNPPYRTLI